jgi:hypothetical protein
MFRLYRTEFRRLLSNERCDVASLQLCEIKLVPWILLRQKTIHERDHIADGPTGQVALLAQVATVLLDHRLARGRNCFGGAQGRDALFAQKIEQLQAARTRLWSALAFFA